MMFAFFSFPLVLLYVAIHAGSGIVVTIAHASLYAFSRAPYSRMTPAVAVLLLPTQDVTIPYAE